VGVLPAPILLLCSACSSTRELCSGDPQAPSEGLALLRQLAGAWVPLDEHGQPASEPSHVFRVTAGGSAVEETVFPGTEQEMVTLYFVQDGRLQLTHYCMAGNQPHMLAERGLAGELAFACDGSGVATEAEGHMHSARMHLTPEGRLVSRWQFVEKGQETELAAFELVRKP
jgi:hypothetical protein